MKRVKIFLASSIEDLQADRLQVGDFFRQLNELYLDSGIHFSLIKCEDYDQSIADGGKQQQYDREIRESELVFFLFFRKVGEYTRHELEVALEAFQNQKKPRIVTYFKYINTLEETVQEVRDFMQLLDQQLKHYYNTYGHIDTLKLGILMQIKLLQLDDSQIKLADGVVQLNGQPMVKAENVPLLQGNRSLQELMQKRRQLQEALTRCRGDYLADPTPEKEAAFFDASAALNRVSKQLAEAEQETMALLTTVAEMTTDGRVLTHRQKEALHHFNLGDYAAVHTILECEEREDELRRAQQRAQYAKQEIQGYIEEELLLIKTEKAQGLTESRVKKVLSGYEKIMALVVEHDLDKAPLFDYACFLHQQNQPQAVAIAEKLRWYYEAPDAVVEDAPKSHLYNLLGVLYASTPHLEEGETMLRKALALRISLAAQSTDSHKANLAATYNNLGNLYCRMSPKETEEKAETAYRKAIGILTPLAAQTPEVYAPALAMFHNNLGSLYCRATRYDKAVTEHRNALAIHNRLVSQNPESHSAALADSYVKLGAALAKTPEKEDSKTFLLNALSIRERLASQNPDAYEPALADSYVNLGNLYAADATTYPDAESCYQKALTIYLRLTQRNAAMHQPNLALTYQNLANLHRKFACNPKAEDAYIRAAEIYTPLAAENLSAYAPMLANTLWNLCRIHSSQYLTEQQQQIIRAALPVLEKLEQPPVAYSSRLAQIRTMLERS